MLRKLITATAIASATAFFVACDEDTDDDIDVCSDDLDCDDGFICEITDEDDGACVEDL